MEPISIGQKIAFACVISFVVLLCVTPFFFQQSDSSGKNTAAEKGQDRDVEQVVRIR